MKVLLIGGGGREHALAWRITQSPFVERLAVTHENPGFPTDAERAEGDPVAWAHENGVDFAVVGPEAPLADGVVDRLAEGGIPAFGPTAAAAQLEASKGFSKDFMARHGIPTAGYSLHEDAASAHATITGPCVVKADGLAAGKGVVVAESAEAAHEAVDSAFDGAFGEAGARVVIEERLTGPEVSVLAVCDGKRAVPMLPCRDHKRRFDGDEGPNTGGMGAICPPPGIDADTLRFIETEVLQRTVDGMAAEGNPFHGVLYAGVMLSPDGPRVLEFNVRFGDPECQPLMMMLDEDLVPVMLAAARGELPDRALRWKGGAAACVVMVAGGYPGPIERGMPIAGVPSPTDDQVVFYAGARRSHDAVVANGGRVLGVTCRAATLQRALDRAYAVASGISFDTAAYRRDIGRTA